MHQSGLLTADAPAVNNPLQADAGPPAAHLEVNDPTEWATMTLLLPTVLSGRTTASNETSPQRPLPNGATPPAPPVEQRPTPIVSSRPHSPPETTIQTVRASSSIGWLLSPLLWLFNFVFVDNIVPTDDFFMRVRKASVGGMLLAFLGQCINIVELWRSSPLPLALFTLFSIFIPMAVTNGFGFVYCKVTKKTPDWLFGTIMITATACRCFLATTSRAYDMGAASAALVVLTLCSRMPLSVEIAVILLTMIALSINTINLQSTGDALLMFPGSSTKTVDLMKHLIGSRSAFIFSTVFFFVMARHFYNILAAKESAVKVSRELAERLQKYDTAGAWNILRGQHEVDPDLLKAFEGIVANLERYRPFLPNYVLDTSEPALEQPSNAEHLVDFSTVASTPLRSKPGAFFRSSISVMDAPSVSELRDDSVTGSVKEDPPWNVDTHSLLDIPPPVAAVEATMLPSNLPLVSVVVMSVQRHNHDDTAAAMWNEFVGIVNDVAQTTGASLHSFLGDQLVATWNGTKRISKPETRACQFALRVRSSVTASVTVRSAFRIASIVGTQPAECYFAGDARLRLFACSSPELWRHTRAALSRVEHLHISAADYATKEAAEYDIEFSAAALLKCPHQALERVGQAAWLQRCCLYELVQERTMDAQTDQEWMYALQQSASKPNQQLVHSMELCALGRTSEAHTKLAQLQRAHAELFVRPVALELLQDLRYCESNNPSTSGE